MDNSSSRGDIVAAEEAQLRSRHPSAWLAVCDRDAQTVVPERVQSFMALRSLPQHAHLASNLTTVLRYLDGHTACSLAVKPSLIPEAGKGLFATVGFSQGELVCVYTGTVLSLIQLMQTEDRDYVMGGFGLNRHVDAKSHPQVLARYINDNLEPGKRNVKFIKLPAQCKALVIALRDITPGEELYVEYGEVHWRNRQHAVSTTND
mmetsp:Transcript_28497/g.51170  ORF Transcript_28497/g.51170 Transcript_28497/m.51170 type:complete len:205 (-) Transcript_28497:207-821(-)